MAHLPLLNKRIVVTRSEEQSGNIAAMLSEAGAAVLLVPTIKIVAAELSAEDRSVVSSYGEYDVVIFPSVNSVRNLFKRIVIGKNAHEKPYIVAIGKKTAEAIGEYGIAADFVPGKFNSTELIRALSRFQWNGKKVLIPVGNLSSSEIPDFVRSNGAMVDRVVVYETVPNDSIDESIKQEIVSQRFDTIIFYSPSQVKNFIDIFGPHILKGKQIAVIGPTTKRSVERHGLRVSIIPENSTSEDLMNSLLQHGCAKAGEDS